MIPKIETERLILRKPKLEDLDDYYDCLNDLDTLKNIKDHFYWPLKKQHVKAKIDYYIKEWESEKPKIYVFFIELKKEKKIIGDVVIRSINNYMGEATTGSLIHRDFRKKGYVTEAKIALINYMFNKLKLNKIISDVFSDNIPSNSVQKKLGYKFIETKIRWGKSPVDGKKHDVNFYELKKEDWEKNLPKLEKEIKKIKRE